MIEKNDFPGIPISTDVINLRLLSRLEGLCTFELEVPTFDMSASRSSTSVAVFGDRRSSFPGFGFANGGSRLALTCLVGEDMQKRFQ